MSLSKWLPCDFEQCHPLLWSWGILVDHWSTISNLVLWEIVTFVNFILLYLIYLTHMNTDAPSKHCFYLLFPSQNCWNFVLYGNTHVIYIILYYKRIHGSHIRPCMAFICLIALCCSMWHIFGHHRATNPSASTGYRKSYDKLEWLFLHDMFTK